MVVVVVNVVCCFCVGLVDLNWKNVLLVLVLVLILFKWVVLWLLLVVVLL